MMLLLNEKKEYLLDYCLISTFIYVFTDRATVGIYRHTRNPPELIVFKTVATECKQNNEITDG